ncbi:MAG: chloride channel protein [Zoogloeaceae bacterium]|jgi:H+/Cl- antiporter ClcA|nr:chloride channel protein [Zoogloeaceae bacterium]
MLSERQSRLLTQLLRRRNAYFKIWLGRLVFWGGAIGVGLLSALFVELSETLSATFMRGVARYWWLPLLVTPLGGAFCVWLTRRYFPGAEGSGIPQALAEMRHPGHIPNWRPLLSLRIIFGKILVGASAVGCGFSLGREGPTVQIGASLMNAIHRWLPASLHIQRNHLLVAGGAAGIAAAFNAPLAGIMFAIEEMSRGVEARMSGLIITAIVLAGVTAQALKGSGGNYFGAILMIAGDSDQLAAVALSVLACGLLGGLFSRMMVLGATAWKGRLADLRARRPVLFAALCGLLVAGLGMVTGGAVFGGGLEQTQALLDADPMSPAGSAHWYFVPAKFIATLTAYFSGLPGGIFAPSLSIGAGIGHDLVQLLPAQNLDDLHGLLQQQDIRNMMLALCMAGFLAAATQAPLTSFLIVMEMINGYSLVISLMVVSLISAGISRLISPPLYSTLAAAIVAKQAASAPPSSPSS